jgi:hypothetical protein
MRSSSLCKSLSAKTNSADSTVPRSRKSDDSLKTKSLKQPCKGNRESKLETRLNQLKPSKPTRNRVPPPQRERILQKFVAGKNITQIAREESRNRESVARIVNGDEIRELVKRMRAELYGLAFDAIVAIRHALREEKDGRIGYRLLMDIGAIPLPAEAEANAVQAIQPQPEELTPYERAIAQDKSGQINRTGLGFARAVEERAAIFGLSLPTAGELWRHRTVAALLDEMTDGQFHHITDSDPEERDRLKKLVDDVLQGKRAMTDKEIVAVQKKYSD